MTNQLINNRNNTKNRNHTQNKKLIDNKDLRQGVFFGMNSGIITTVGLIAGISHTVTNPMYLIISVISIAISDGAGEAYGIYLSKKAEKVDDQSKGPLFSMFSLFTSKVFVVLFFLVPLLFKWDLKYYKNLIWPVLWSLITLTYLDYNLSKLRNESILNYVIPHYLLLFVVVASTKIIGISLSRYE